MNTVFLILAEFETTDIPLKDIAHKYFGITERKMNEWARHNEFPFPVFRGGSQKSQWLVSAVDLGAWIDKKRAKAKQEFDLLHRAS